MAALTIAADERCRLQADRAIALIDGLIADQIDAIRRHQRFRRLEAAWRGLAFLTETADRNDGVKIRALSITWNEIARDLERAPEFDRSHLFNKVYEQEFGMPGGEPYGLLIGDYEVSHRRNDAHPTDDVAVLSSLAQIAAASFAPFIVGAAPDLLGMDTFAELATGVVGRSRTPVGSGDVQTLARPVYQTEIARLPDYARWRALRQRGDARFLGLVLPHCLCRPADSDASDKMQPFRSNSSRKAPDSDDYLWMSAAFPFAAAVIGAFGRSGWFTDLRGSRRGEGGGGLVEGLPPADFTTDEPGVARRAPVEVEIDYMQERALDELGLIPLMRAYATPDLLFFANSSLHLPPQYDDAAANASARLSSMLQYILCVSRFAHYIKVLGRDRIGAAGTAEQCRAMLQQWIAPYCTSDDEASAAMLARYPLREAAIEVQERPDQPGVYTCSVWLKPHFQLDQIVSAYEIVTELAPLGSRQ